MKANASSGRTITLNWTWDSPFNNIVIRDGETVVGTIEDFREQTISSIYGDLIQLERQGFAGQHIYFNDPVDNKAYCQYDSDKITAPHRYCIIIDNILCEIVKGKYKHEYRKIAELRCKKTFFGNFRNNGELIFYDTAHIGTDIYSLFYDLLFRQD